MKDHEKQEMEKLEELRKVIEASPLTQKIIAEKAAAVLATRQEAARKIEQVNQEAEALIPQRQGAVAVVETELIAHGEERKAILDKLAKARVALMQERQRLNAERASAEAVLLSNYDGRIDEAITWFRDRHDVLRAKTPDHDTHKTGTNIFTWTKQFTTYSNLPVLKSALTYCRVSIEQLEAMKLVPEVDMGQIDALKKGIPDVGTLTQTTVEKPLPREVDPLNLLPTDSQMEWQIGKLGEKFKKIMGRRT